MSQTQPQHAGVPAFASETEKNEFTHMEENATTLVRYDDAEARKIRRKVDFRLLPILVLLYFLAFLDRVNIGNARLWHLERDLGMSGLDYNIVVLVFYIPYILFGIPSNMLLTRFRPAHYIGGLTVCWGLTVAFVGFSTSMTGMVVCRLLLGTFEAGMFPACMYLINTWYRRHEMATRMSWFMVANDVAGIASGLLGAGIGSLDGAGGYSGWSWIFFVEGAMTFFGGILGIFFILDFPQDSDFLKPEEKEWWLENLRVDNGKGPRETRMTLQGVKTALSDWKVLISGVLYLAACNTAYSVAIFMPTILGTFGWGPIRANLLSSPVRVLSAIFAIAVGIASDRLKIRGPFMCIGFVVSIVGCFMVAFLTDRGARYAGLYFTGLGVLSIQPTIIGWCVGQVVGANKRGTLTAFASSVGQLGGIISALSFPSSDGPQYVIGNMVNVGISSAGLICSAWLWGWSVWENKQREAGKRDHRRSLPQEEQDRLGEKHPDFRFTP